MANEKRVIEHLAILWRGRLTPVQFLAGVGGILLALFLAGLWLRFAYPIDFEKSPLTSLDHLFTLYHHRYGLIVFLGVLLLVLALLYLKRMQDLNLPIKIGIWPVLTLYGALFYLLCRFEAALGHFDYSFRFISQLGSYLSNPTQAGLAALIPAETLSLLQESRYGFYFMLGSYFFLALTAIFPYSQQPYNRFGAQWPSKIFTKIVAIMVFGLFLYSSFFVVQKTIVEDPFHLFTELEKAQKRGQES